MWKSSFLVNLQACRLKAGNFTNRWPPSQVFVKTILSPAPCSPCIDSSSPIKFWRALTRVLNTCGKTWWGRLSSPFHLSRYDDMEYIEEITDTRQHEYKVNVVDPADGNMLNYIKWFYYYVWMFHIWLLKT